MNFENKYTPPVKLRKPTDEVRNIFFTNIFRFYFRIIRMIFIVLNVIMKVTSLIVTHVHVFIIQSVLVLLHYLKEIGHVQNVKYAFSFNYSLDLLYSFRPFNHRLI